MDWRTDRDKRLSKAKRVLIKVGSAVLTCGDGLDFAVINSLAEQIAALHARGCDVRRMASIVGAASLSEEEQRLLAFSDRFERELIGQGETFRTFEETLDLGWRLLAAFPAATLSRVRREDLARYHHPEGSGAAA